MEWGGGEDVWVVVEIHKLVFRECLLNVSADIFRRMGNNMMLGNCKFYSYTFYSVKSSV